MATLTIDLDDEASEGLQAIDAQLEQMAETTDQLTAAQERQITVVHEQRASWSALGVTATGALGQVASSGMKLAAVLAPIYERQRLINAAQSTFAAVSVVTTSSLGKQVTQWGLLGQAAQTGGVMALKAMTGLGPQVLGATIALKGYEAILARTGLKTVELADGTKVVESNLDRVQGSLAKLGGDIRRDFAGAAEVAKEFIGELNFLPSIWKAIDPIATKSAENLVSNINMIRKAYSGADGELADWHAKMEAQREKEAEGFAMLGRANDELRGRQEYRAEQARLASINTIEGLNQEIQKTKEAAGAAATAGKFDAEAKEEYYQTMDFLELQRAKITENVEKARRDQFAKSRKAHEEAINAEQDKLGEYMRRMQEVYDLEHKRHQERARMARELREASRDQDTETVMDASKDLHEGDKARVDARLRAQGATEIQVKHQLAEMDRQFAESAYQIKMQSIADEWKARDAVHQKERLELEKSGLKGIEYEKRLSKIKADEDKMVFDLRKKAIEETGRYQREQNKLTTSQQLANEQALFAKEAERIQKIKALQREAIGKAFNPQEVLNSTDPQKVLRQIQENRARQAGQAQADRDRELWEKGQAGDKAAMNKFAANQRKEMAKARRLAYNDAENGNVGEGELATAQAQVAGEQLGLMQQQGRVTADTAVALQEALKAIADQATATEQMQTTVNQLVANAKGIRQATKRQAENSRNQQGSLE